MKFRQKSVHSARMYGCSVHTKQWNQWTEIRGTWISAVPWDTWERSRSYSEIAARVGLSANAL